MSRSRTSAEPASLAAGLPSAKVRAWASAAIVLHLAAVFVAPFAVQPTSELGTTLRDFFRPYIEINDLDHGYKFFDEPGPSFLVRYQLKFADGRPPAGGIFPNLEEHRPRLLYHRHLMLADHLHRAWMMAEPPPDLAAEPNAPAAARQGTAMANGDRPPGEIPPDAARWIASRRALRDSCLKSYARRLLQRHGASEVTLYGIERRLPSPEDIRQGKRLGAAEFTGETRLGRFTE
ncbi:MAG: hypothetical protein WD176_07860 [Pirellulales bacterium]